MVAGLLQIDDGHHGRQDAADHHERLPYVEPVGDDPDQDDPDDVEAPVPVAKPVGVLDREVEHGDEVDDGEADRGVVDQQHDRDGDGGDDDVRLEQLPERVPQSRLDVDPLGPGLDQRAVPRRHHQLVPQLRGELLQPDQGDREDDDPDSAADAVFGRPEPRVADDRRNGGTADDRHDQAAQDRAAGPEAHRGGPSHLRGEVADQRGSGDQADALDHADREALDAEDPLTGGSRQDERGEDGGDEQPADDEVGAAHPVAEPGEQRAERSDQVPECEDHHVEREAHLQVAQQQRGDRAADIRFVVQRDGGQHRNRQIADAGPVAGIPVELPAPQDRYPVATGNRRVTEGRAHY